MRHLALLASRLRADRCARPARLDPRAGGAAPPAATETAPAEQPQLRRPTAPPAAPRPRRPEPARAAPEPQFLADERARGARADAPKAVAAASGSVTIADFSFTPGTITINQGDTVTWVNNGPTPHSATANDGSFNTGILEGRPAGSHTFNQAGTFAYFCSRTRS